MKGDNKVYISRKKDLGTPYFDFFESDKGLEIVCHSCDDPDVIDNAKILINNVSRDGERFYILSGLHGRMWDDWLHHHLKLYVGTPSKLEAVGNPKFHHETEYSTIDFEYDGEHGRYIFHKIRHIHLFVQSFCQTIHNVDQKA